MIETLHPTVSARGTRVAFFDFDGTLSLIRAGWMEVMVPMMVDILTATGTEESPRELRNLVEDYVARLTGEQTIYQMIELARQVALRRGEPLDPVVYKKMYHDRLMAKIGARREVLLQGKVSPDNFLVPGARAMLEALQKRGLILYCASGTDDGYTREEADLLDISRYFDGGIYGALDDYKSFSKDILIHRITSSLACRGEELLGFGDGYVEIKNIKDAGGVAVGVATDEPECRAVNQWKRDRLAAVGADYIIPNFLCHEYLLQTLFRN